MDNELSHTTQTQSSASNTARAPRAVTLIAYTTRYRTGGEALKLAAETHAELRASEGEDVIVSAVESKAEFVALLTSAGLTSEGERAEGEVSDHERAVEIKELAFFGHSGLYGPMFRTTAMPEQLSPHEWRSLVGLLRFAPNAEATFYACRTARWFAPFFARTFGIPTSGFHEYTTFSKDPERFVWPGRHPQKPLFLKGCRGKKSDGLIGSVKKYLGVALERPARFEPAQVGEEASYARVAELYDAVFSDIRVREDEWRWLQAPLGQAQRALKEGEGLSLLDIGCGNGALLSAISEAFKVARGVGLDSSPQMIEQALKRQAHHSHLSFEVIDGPTIPLPNESVDVALSLLSWRYLDWDPLMIELMRVLKPGGRLLVIDMVTAPPKLSEWPALARDTLKARWQRRRHPAYQAHLKRLVSDPAWAEMLRYNPIRAQHELVWYFESRFEGRKVEVLNVGRRARVLAFDSGPLGEGRHALPQSYP